MKEYKKLKYMMATKAGHGLGEISRDEPDLCHVKGEVGDDYIGSWVEGFGFFDVRFPKETTRDLTNDEVHHYAGLMMSINGQPTYSLTYEGLGRPDLQGATIDLDNINYKVIKLSLKTNAELDSKAFAKGEMICGEIQGNRISIGERMKVSRGFEYLNTSPIKSVYQHETNSGWDKLTLSSEFGDTKDIYIPELTKGDILVATHNSIYLVRR